MNVPKITTVNVYVVNAAWRGEPEAETWCYAAWSGDDFDHTGTLDDAETMDEARAEVLALFPGASVNRI